MGAEITITIGNSTTTIDKGIYDPKTMLSLKKLTEIGLVEILGYDEVKGVENLHYNYYENDSKYNEFEKSVDRAAPALKGREKEVADCIRMLIYGTDWDNDGVVDYNIDISELDPLVFGEAVQLIYESTGKQYCEYIYR
jgi:hypothetical protein